MRAAHRPAPTSPADTPCTIRCPGPECQLSADAIYQIIGYVGSALILVSVTRTSILKLRLFGLAGSTTFLIYSLLIGAYPIAVVNVVVIFVHLFFLRDLLANRNEYFTVLEVRPDSRYLAYFLEFYDSEIRRFQPEFAYEASDDERASFILRDLVPAGLFIGRPCDDHSMQVELDFVIPQYRDLKIGDFLYSDRSGVFADPKCDRAWSYGDAPEHAQYLERMGFNPARNRDGRMVYVKDLRQIHATSEP